MTSELKALENQLDEIQVKIRSSEINNKRYDKRKKIGKLNLSDVYGFLNELIFPSHKTYDTALKVGLIKFMNLLLKSLLQII